MLEKSRERLGNIRKGGMAGFRARARHRWLLILILFFFIGAVFYSSSYAGIPEPGIVLYGKVFDAGGTLLTSGELQWAFTPEGGGDTVTITTQLTQIDAEGGPYSYRVTVPLESDLAGSGSSADAIPITDTPVQYTRVGTVTGTGITKTDSVTISTASRGTFELVTLGTPSITDMDHDGLDDNEEQKIVDADLNDSITSINDVLAGDDFDNDGESNGYEINHYTDPTDAFSTFHYGNAYTDFHFEIYRGAEQDELGGLTESYWGAKLICWPREGETIVSGELIKPNLNVIALITDPSGSEAGVEETGYSDLQDLEISYPSGEYRVNLVMDDGGADPYTLRFKISVQEYSDSNFPDYVGIVSPSANQTDVALAPLFHFQTGLWDYLTIAKEASGQLSYFHYRDNNDIPATNHKVPDAQALEGRTLYTLMADTNRWGDTWFGSQTLLTFSTIGEQCYGDSDEDGDVDGMDLSAFDVEHDSLQEFSSYYGKSTCEIP